MSTPNATTVGAPVRSRAPTYSSCCSPGTSKVVRGPTSTPTLGTTGRSARPATSGTTCSTTNPGAEGA